MVRRWFAKWFMLRNLISRIRQQRNEIMASGSCLQEKVVPWEKWLLNFKAQSNDSEVNMDISLDFCCTSVLYCSTEFWLWKIMEAKQLQRPNRLSARGKLQRLELLLTIPLNCPVVSFLAACEPFKHARVLQFFHCYMHGVHKRVQVLLVSLLFFPWALHYLCHRSNQ